MATMLIGTPMAYTLSDADQDQLKVNLTKQL
jgi:hypothetical protein